MDLLTSTDRHANAYTSVASVFIDLDIWKSPGKISSGAIHLMQP
jgi:hypothetical protein